jgi:hypothetical protein
MIISNSIKIKQSKFNAIEEKYDCLIQDLFTEHGIEPDFQYGFGSIISCFIDENSDLSLLEDLAEFIDSGSFIIFKDKDSCDGHMAFVNGKVHIRYPIINQCEQ